MLSSDRRMTKSNRCNAQKRWNHWNECECRMDCCEVIDERRIHGPSYIDFWSPGVKVIVFDVSPKRGGEERGG